MIVLLATSSMAGLAMAEDLPPGLGGTDAALSTDSPESTSSTDSDSVTATEILETTPAVPTLYEETSADTSATTTSTETTTPAFTDFEDVSVDDPYYNPIIVLRYQGLLKGYDDNTFHPDQPLNRVEALKLVFEAADIKITNGIAPAEFNDTEDMAWYSGYLNKAVYLEVVSGYADGSFKPAQSVNLVEFLKMLLLAQGEDLSDTNLNQLPYADVMPGQWYSKYVNFSKIHDLLRTADDNNIFPGEPLTRARAADIIYRFRNMKAKGTDTTTPASTSTTSSDIIPVKDFALFVSASNKFAVQYPKIWFYSAFVEKPDAADIAVYGFGPDDLDTNAPLVTLELLPDDSAYETNLVDNGFIYLRQDGETGLIKLSAKIEGSTRIYRVAGPVEQEANMLTMLKSLTPNIEGLESFNPSVPATTETPAEVTETPAETIETPAEVTP